MNSQKKQLSESIEELKQTALFQKRKLEEHQQYFSKLLNSSKYIMLGLAATTFFAGWAEGKKARAGKKLIKFTQFIIGTSLSALRRLYL